MLKTIAKFGAANVYKMYHESSICDWHFVKYTIQKLEFGPAFGYIVFFPLNLKVL